ncbi:hypothetical protein ACFQ7W_05845 [Streptomyces niveus]|uniref:hypothetical protein n=1 Tax=Streptomyces niveus TaxID=193462 RepID=UPI0036A14841
MSIKSQAKKGAETYEPKAYLIDVGTIRDAVSIARETPVLRDARPQIASTTATMIGMLELLLGEDLNFDRDEAVRSMYEAAYRLLRVDRRPTNDDPTVVAWQYMRDVAEMTSQLVETYAGHRGEGGSDVQ